MAKATHYGICQVCGRRQTLPGGKLSKHGYEVSHGFFNGVCFGAGHLPFEQSKDMVEADIERCLAEIPKREAQAAAIRANNAVIWVHEYVPATYERGQRQSFYIWREIKVEDMVEIGYHVKWTGRYGKAESATFYSNDKFFEATKGLEYGSEEYKAAYREFAIVHFNNERAKQIDQGILGLKNHITHQRIRIQDWEPKELQEIKRAS